MPKANRAKKSRRMTVPAQDRRYVPVALRHAVERRADGTCVYCGVRKGVFEPDHVIPWSQGGKTRPDNLVLACERCNGVKHDWPMELFAARLELEGRGKAADIIARVYAQLSAPISEE